MTSSQYDTPGPKLNNWMCPWLGDQQANGSAVDCSQQAVVDQVMQELTVHDWDNEAADEALFGEELFDSLFDWPDWG